MRIAVFGGGRRGRCARYEIYDSGLGIPVSRIAYLVRPLRPPQCTPSVDLRVSCRVPVRESPFRVAGRAAVRRFFIGCRPTLSGRRSGLVGRPLAGRRRGREDVVWIEDGQSHPSPQGLRRDKSDGPTGPLIAYARTRHSSASSAPSVVPQRKTKNALHPINPPP